MATSSDVQGKFDDLLKCTICLETFKTPKYLPCLHTFCQACIHTYILSTVKEDKSDSITCPVCRRPTPIEGLSKGKLETLAEQLPSNHFVISMMDEKAIKNNEKLCSVCERHSKSQKAISWCSVCEEAYCETCENYHKTFRATSDHTLIALKDIISDVTSSNLFCYVACREHSGKTIELYCKDHSKLCCTLCATVQHRKCEQVVTIDQVISGVKQSTKAKELSKKLTEFSQEIDEMLQASRENINSFKEQLEDILTQIGKAREIIVKQIEKIEQKLRDEVLSAKKETHMQLNELSSYKCTIDNWKAIFDACLKRGSEIQCLAKMEELLEKLPTIEDNFSSYHVK